MPISPPGLDVRDYEQLLDELLGRIAVYTPEWTDFNESDPGIALIELFAFLAESLLWQIDQRKRRRRRRRLLSFLLVTTAGIGVFLWRAGKDRNA
jgi:hypothetical protein